MKRVLLIIVLLTGCAAKELPPPPVPPVPPTLWEQTTWEAPRLIDEPAPIFEVPPAVPPPPRPNELVFAWEPNMEYVVPVQIGWPLDIQYQRGEWVSAYAEGDRGYLAEGETRWQVETTIEGGAEEKGQQRTHHLWTCAHPGHTQGVVTITDRRAYHLSLKCVGKTPTRVVRWTYPPPPAKPQEPAVPRVLPDPWTPRQYQVGYTIEAGAGAEELRPLWVGNDREHIYLIFPPTILAEKMPMVREVGQTGPALVNSRQPVGKPVIVVDGLSPRLELRYGEGEFAQVVVITRQQLTTIQCPGESGCPVWPAGRRPEGTAQAR